MRVSKYYNNEKVYSIKDLSVILNFKKSEIKNSIKAYSLSPIVIENRVGYYGVSTLCEFIEYLILRENLRLIKSRIKRFQV